MPPRIWPVPASATDDWSACCCCCCCSCFCWLHPVAVRSMLGPLKAEDMIHLPLLYHTLNGRLGHSHLLAIVATWSGRPSFHPLSLPGFFPSPEGRTLQEWSTSSVHHGYLGIDVALNWRLLLYLSYPSQSLGLERHQRLYEPHLSFPSYLPIPHLSPTSTLSAMKTPNG